MEPAEWRALGSDDPWIAEPLPASVATSGDPLALERQVCFALQIASRSVLAIYRPLLDALGLTHPQYLVMLALWGSAPLTVKEIGALLQLDSATLSPLLKRLAVAGYVTRMRGSDDERVLVVDLTDAGRALRANALEVPPAIVAQLGMGLSELESLHGSLTKLIAAARASGAREIGRGTVTTAAPPA